MEPPKFEAEASPIKACGTSSARDDERQSVPSLAPSIDNPAGDRRRRRTTTH